MCQLSSQIQQKTVFCHVCFWVHWGWAGSEKHLLNTRAYRKQQQYGAGRGGVARPPRSSGGCLHHPIQCTHTSIHHFIILVSFCCQRAPFLDTRSCRNTVITKECHLQCGSIPIPRARLVPLLWALRPNRSKGTFLPFASSEELLVQPVVASVASVEAPASSAETPKPDKHLARMSVPCCFPNQVVSTGGTGDGLRAPADAHCPAGQSSRPSAPQDSTLQRGACTVGG